MLCSTEVFYGTQREAEATNGDQAAPRNLPGISAELRRSVF